MRIIVFAFAFALISVVTCLAEMPKVGDKVPDFEMKGTDGKTYSAEDFVGKQAFIIAWYPRAFTGGCTKECKSLREASQQLKRFDVSYFAASTDPVDKNSEFAKSLDLDFPILSDPSGKAATAFGVLRPDGKAANRVTFIVGQDGRILEIDKQISTETHGQDLSQKLASLDVAERATK